MFEMKNNIVKKLTIIFRQAHFWAELPLALYLYTKILYS